jgi:hypothetical protein
MRVTATTTATFVPTRWALGASKNPLGNSRVLLRNGRCEAAANRRLHQVRRRRLRATLIPADGRDWIASSDRVTQWHWPNGSGLWRSVLFPSVPGLRHSGHERQVAAAHRDRGAMHSYPCPPLAHTRAHCTRQPSFLPSATDCLPRRNCRTAALLVGLPGVAPQEERRGRRQEGGH